MYTTNTLLLPYTIGHLYILDPFHWNILQILTFSHEKYCSICSIYTITSSNLCFPIQWGEKWSWDVIFLFMKLGVWKITFHNNYVQLDMIRLGLWNKTWSENDLVSKQFASKYSKNRAITPPNFLKLVNLTNLCHITKGLENWKSK